MGNGAYFFGKTLLSIYSSEADVIAYGLLRMSVICVTYCLCGIMDVMVGSIRGLGYSILPMIVSLAGACGFRIIWIYTVFQKEQTLMCLYTSYPISWALTALVHVICFVIIFKRVKQKMQ